MSVIAPAAPSVLDDGPQNAYPAATEASKIGRVVTFLTPLFTVASAWVAGWVAQHTGATLDTGEITAFMVVTSTVTFGAVWKWLRGWQQHELLVANGLDAPVKRGPDAPLRPAPDHTPPLPKS